MVGKQLNSPILLLHLPPCMGFSSDGRQEPSKTSCTYFLVGHLVPSGCSQTHAIYIAGKCSRRGRGDSTGKISCCLQDLPPPAHLFSSPWTTYDLFPLVSYLFWPRPGPLMVNIQSCHTELPSICTGGSNALVSSSPLRTPLHPHTLSLKRSIGRNIWGYMQLYPTKNQL